MRMPRPKPRCSARTGDAIPKESEGPKRGASVPREASARGGSAEPSGCVGTLPGVFGRTRSEWGCCTIVATNVTSGVRPLHSTRLAASIRQRELVSARRVAGTSRRSSRAGPASSRRGRGHRTTAVTVASRPSTSWLIEPSRNRASAPRPCVPTTASRAVSARSCRMCDGNPRSTARSTTRSG